MNALAPAADAVSAARSLADALDYRPLRRDRRNGGSCRSYWHRSPGGRIARERLTIEAHCRQIAAVTREAFETVKSLGAGSGTE